MATAGRTIRVGVILPSADASVEATLPDLLRSQGMGRATLHASRIRIPREGPAPSAAALNAHRERCVLELGDLRPDLILFACSAVALRVGPGEVWRTESLMAEQLAHGGSDAVVRSTFGSVVAELRARGAVRVALLESAPFASTSATVAGLAEHGIEVVRSCDVRDGGGDAETWAEAAESLRDLDLDGVDAVVCSATEPILSTEVTDAVERHVGVPVISSGTAVARSISEALGVSSAATTAPTRQLRS